MGRKKLLVVDDLPLMRVMLKKYLAVIASRAFPGLDSACEVEVLEAKDGSEALEVLSQHKDTMDFIFLDIMMPVMDGITFLQKKNEDPKTASIPVIVTTALNERGAVKDALSLGAHAYLQKPFALKAVESKLKEVVEVPEKKPSS